MHEDNEGVESQTKSSIFARISKRDLFIAILSVVLLLVSIALEKTADHSIHSVWSQATLSEFIRDVSFALVIAFSVIATVELESRLKFSAEVKDGIKEIQKNVFKATYERHIPRDVLDEINELVFSSYFVRTKHVSHFAITLVEISEIAAAQILMRSDYTVQNVGNIARQFEIKIALEKHQSQRSTIISTSKSRIWK